MNLDEEKKCRLRIVLWEHMHPVHCPSCDGWMCDEDDNDFDKAVDFVLDEVWKEIVSWEREKGTN